MDGSLDYLIIIGNWLYSVWLFMNPVSGGLD